MKKIIFILIILFALINCISLAQALYGSCPSTINGCCEIASSGTFNLTRDILPGMMSENYCFSNRAYNNVVIDGKGYSLDCGGAPKTAITILSGTPFTPRSNIVIKNITIKNCFKAISVAMNSASNIKIYNSTILGSSNTGIYIGPSKMDYIEIQGCNISYNKQAIYLNTDHATIRNNFLYSNGAPDINSTNLTLKNSVVENNIVSTSSTTQFPSGLYFNIITADSNNIIRNNTISCNSNFIFDIARPDLSVSNYISTSLSTNNTFNSKRIQLFNDNWPVLGTHYTDCNLKSDKILCSQLNVTMCNLVNISSDTTFYPYLDIILSAIQDIPPQESDCIGSCGEFRPDIAERGVPGNRSTCGIIFYCGCKWSSSSCLQERGWRETISGCVKDTTLTSCLNNNCKSNVNSLIEDCNTFNDNYRINWTVETPGTDCSNGEKMFPCQSTSTLPFFTGFNFIISILIIISFYYLILKRQCKIT